MSAQLAATMVALLSGCGTSESADGGDPGALDSGAHDAGTICARVADCEDGLYCTEHRCEPGASGADPRGCVLVADAPCGDGMRCHEEDRRCVPADCIGLPDADGDGHDAIACGGDDCDDFDPARFPGNTEVCDLDGHDEDCDPSTYGAVDDDEDGFVDAACCNGARCADDCNDGDRAIAPGATESCDGVDEDCDGAVDESSTPLCPGGVCVAGRCDLGGWDRAFGGDTNEDIFGTAIDAEGNVYIVGEFASDLRFGSESIETRGSTDAFLASYGPDGSFRWVRQLGTAGREHGAGVAHHGGSDLILVHVSTDGDGELMAGVGPSRSSTVESTFLIAMRPSGELSWHREIFATADGTVGAGPVAAQDGVTVVSRLGPGSFFVDGSTGPRPIPENQTFIASYTASGALESLFEIGTSGSPRGVAVDRAGNAYLAEVGAGLASFDREGNLRWRAVSAAGVNDVAVSDERVFAVGGFDEPVDLGSGSAVGAAGPGRNGFIVALRHDGTYVDATTWALEAGTASAVAVDSSGGPIVSGFFFGDLELGGGHRRSTPGGSVFYTALDHTLVHRSDSAFSAPACVTEDFCPSFPYDIAVGPADSTAIVGAFAGSIDFGSGPRVSVGSLDGFVVRLAN